MKIQKAIKDETIHIALGVIVLSFVMEAVFALIGQWSMSVLWGNLLGGIYAVLNFFILGLTVQKVANDADPKHGKNLMQFSYSSRMFGTMIVVFLGFALPFLNWVAVLIPQFFPRITIAFMGFSGKAQKDAQKELELKQAAARHSEMLSKKPVSVDVAEAEAEAAELEAEAALAKAKAARARAAAAKARAEAEEESAE